MTTKSMFRKGIQLLFEQFCLIRSLIDLHQALLPRGRPSILPPLPWVIRHTGKVGEREDSKVS